MQVEIQNPHTARENGCLPANIDVDSEMGAWSRNGSTRGLGTGLYQEPKGQPFLVLPTGQLSTRVGQLLETHP